MVYGPGGVPVKRVICRAPEARGHGHVVARCILCSNEAFRSSRRVAILAQPPVAVVCEAVRAAVWRCHGGQNATRPVGLSITRRADEGRKAALNALRKPSQTAPLRLKNIVLRLQNGHFLDINPRKLPF